VEGAFQETRVNIHMYSSFVFLIFDVMFLIRMTTMCFVKNDCTWIGDDNKVYATHEINTPSFEYSKVNRMDVLQQYMPVELDRILRIDAVPIGDIVGEWGKRKNITNLCIQ